MVEKSMVVSVTNYTIRDLMPGQTYSVQICAVREGYSPNCTEPKEYSTTVQGELQTLLHACVPCQLSVVSCSTYSVHNIYSVSNLTHYTV